MRVSTASETVLALLLMGHLPAGLVVWKTGYCHSSWRSGKPLAIVAYDEVACDAGVENGS
jgi:hypothetical protein